MGGAEAVCEYLEWDSAFFGHRIGRVIGSRLDAERAARVDAWCDLHGVECVYYLAEAEDLASIHAAEASGFRFVDLRMTLDRDPRAGGVGAGEARGTAVRQWREDDVPALRAIAARSHHDSRFYADPSFPRERCDALYATWIEKSCHGYADTVLVAEHAEDAAGYIACQVRDGNRGHIGLFAVDPQAQGNRLGEQLVGAAMRWFAARGAANVLVVTQGRNCQAQRRYLRCGFLPRALQLWFHRWRVPAP